MKKLVFVLILLISLTISNFAIRSLHIKAIESTIDNTREKLSASGITLELSKLKFHGITFWNLSGEVSDTEIYTTVSQSVIYFKVPEIKIYSKLFDLQSFQTDILLPSHINGLLDINEFLASQLNINQKYKIFLETPNQILIQALTNLDESTKVTFDLRDLIAQIMEKDSQEKQKAFDIQSIEVQSGVFHSGDLNWTHEIDIKDLNIYLGLAEAAKYLPKSISLDDAAKNIYVKTCLSKKVEHKTDFESIKYYGSFDSLTRAFEIGVRGDNTVEKAMKDKKSNKSNLMFRIKHLETLIDYFNSIFQNIKKQQNEHYNDEKLQHFTETFKNILLENSKHHENDTIEFQIQDTKTTTLFQGKPIKEVFGHLIEQTKMM